MAHLQLKKECAADEYLHQMDTIGSVVVRNLFSPQLCDVIISDTEQVYGWIIGEKRPKKGANSLHFDGIVAQPNPHFRSFVINLIAKFVETDAFQVFQRAFGERVCFPLQQCCFRYQRPDHFVSHLPYHQDARPDKLEARVINCWIALMDCGDDAPSVEIMNTRITSLQGDVYDTGKFFRVIDPSIDPVTAQQGFDQLVNKRFGHDGSTIPVFRAGDAIMFDHFTLHRTHFSRSMTKPRMSVEIRACDPVLFDKYYGNYDRIVVEPAGDRLRLSLMTHQLEMKEGGEHVYVGMPVSAEPVDAVIPETIAPTIVEMPDVGAAGTPETAPVAEISDAPVAVTPETAYAVEMPDDRAATAASTEPAGPAMPLPTSRSTILTEGLRGDVKGLLKQTAQTSLNRAGFMLVRNQTFAALQAKAERAEAAEARAEAAEARAEAAEKTVQAANVAQVQPAPEPKLEPTPPPPKVIGDPAEINAALDRACERLAMRSVGEAQAICDEVARRLPDHVPPAHFHMMAGLDGFLADSIDREIVLCSSRLAHIRFMITQALSEHLLSTHEHMSLMVASQAYYDGVVGNERNRNPKRLMRHGRKVFSQSDEDGLIEEVFRRIGTKHKTFIEIGVQSGIESNTTKLLMEGWSGAWIECSANFVGMAKALFQQFIASGKLRVLHRFVTVESIESILSQTGLGPEIDLLSLDIDGNDIWVWQAIRSISPRVMIIEYNATYAPPLCNAVPYQPDRLYGGTSYFGASLGALTKVGDEKGYHLVGCSFRGNNAIFVRKDLCADHFQAPFTAEEHFEPIRHPVVAPWGYLPDFGRFVFV